MGSRACAFDYQRLTAVAPEFCYGRVIVELNDHSERDHKELKQLRSVSD